MALRSAAMIKSLPLIYVSNVNCFAGEDAAGLRESLIDPYTAFVVQSARVTVAR
jgi:hypothetical protein